MENDVIDAPAICAEFDIEIVGSSERVKAGQTRAVATIARIGQTFGEGHLRLVLSTLAETKGNDWVMTEVTLWAVSDLVRACSEWIEDDVSSWFEAWDRIPLGYLMWNCRELSGIVKQRHALAGAIYTMLLVYSENRKANRSPDYDFLRRVLSAEGVMGKRHQEKQHAIEAGKTLLEVKSSLPDREFQNWLREKSGLSGSRVRRYMEMAKQDAA